MKQWSLGSVSQAHGYNNIQYAQHHNVFIDWISKNFYKKIDIVDIGGGNANIFLELKKYTNEYWNLDLNASNLRTCISEFKNEPAFNCILFDIDKQDFSINCDVVYIDSVLSMIDEPFEALLKFKNFCNYIFVNRINLKYFQTKKKNYQWAGMDSESVLWQFDKVTLNNFCQKHGMEFQIIDSNVFLIKTNKTSNLN